MDNLLHQNENQISRHCKPHLRAWSQLINTEKTHIHCSVMATIGQFLYPGSGIEVLEEEYDENFEPTQKGNYKYVFFCV